jgi:hypothetical protein
LTEPVRVARGASNLDPALIRIANVVGWVWLAAAVVALLVFGIFQLPRLGSTLWLYWAGGRSSGAAAVPFATVVVAVVATALVLLFAAVMIVSRRVAAPSRAWPIVLVILFSWAVSVVMATILVSAAPQVDVGRQLDSASAYGLIAASAQPVVFVVGLVALLSAIGLPLLALARGRRRA